MRARRSEATHAVEKVLPAESKAELGDDDHAFLRGQRRRWDLAEPAVKIVDLFAGCGGLSLGAIEAAAAMGRAARVVLAAELEPTVRKVYRANFPEAAVSSVGDVTVLFDGALGAPRTKGETALRRRVGSIDVLVGGPPCQGHSNLNNHTRLEDDRNLLYLRMVRAAEVLSPTSVVIENVPGVQRDRHGVLETAIQRLTELGYQVDHGTVSVEDLGVPQSRVRHLLIASRVGAPSMTKLVQEHTVPRRDVRWAIGDLEQVHERGNLFDSPAVISPENQSRAEWLLRHGEFDLPNRKRPPCHRDKPDHKYVSMYGRLRWSAPAQTITTGYGSPGQGRYFHPSKPRTLTPHEAARLQFFPDWFDFGAAGSRSALAHCIGNAVPPKLGYAAVRHLLRTY